MQTDTRSLLQHHLLWGLGLGAAVVLSTQILTWVGLGLSHLTWVSTYVLVIVFAVLGGRSLQGRLGRAPGFLRAALLILVMILVSRVIYQTYMFLYINYVDPGWVDMVAEVWSAQLREAGQSADQIAKSIDGFRRQWETGYVFTLGIVSFGIAQFVLGLITVTLAVVRPWRRQAA